MRERRPAHSHHLNLNSLSARLGPTMSARRDSRARSSVFLFVRPSTSVRSGQSVATLLPPRPVPDLGRPWRLRLPGSTRRATFSCVGMNKRHHLPACHHLGTAESIPYCPPSDGILTSFSSWRATLCAKTDTDKNTMKCVGTFHVSGAQPLLIFGKPVAWVPCEPASGPKRITTSARRTPRSAVKSVKVHISFTWFSGSRVTCSLLSFFLPESICAALPLLSRLWLNASVRDVHIYG